MLILSKNHIKLLLLILLSVSLTACKSSKRTTSKTPKTTKTRAETRTFNPVAESLIKHAKSYEGVKYKYGGNTKKGMDCSGLLYTVFQTEGIVLPRTSAAMAKQGEWIDIKNVQPGDLVFFATGKNSRKINHVGLVTGTRLGHLEFIHASTSKGVITSSLAERYWYFAYVQARRLL